jgi:hypothetical protein
MRRAGLRIPAHFDEALKAIGDVLKPHIIILLPLMDDPLRFVMTALLPILKSEADKMRSTAEDQLHKAVLPFIEAVARSLPSLILSGVRESGVHVSEKHAESLENAFEANVDVLKPHVLTLLPLMDDSARFMATALPIIMETLEGMTSSIADEAPEAAKAEGMTNRIADEALEAAKAILQQKLTRVIAKQANASDTQANQLSEALLNVIEWDDLRKTLTTPVHVLSLLGELGEVGVTVLCSMIDQKLRGFLRQCGFAEDKIGPVSTKLSNMIETDMVTLLQHPDRLVTELVRLLLKAPDLAEEIVPLVTRFVLEKWLLSLRIEAVESTKQGALIRDKGRIRRLFSDR